MKILFTGGGTGGSVIPLIAVYKALKKKSNNLLFFWIGGYKGIECKIIKSYSDIKYFPILGVKLHRYWSLKNLLIPFLFPVAFVQAFLILLKIKPDRIISVGGYIGVPVLYAGWLLRIPIFIHQLDIRPTFSNKLTAFTARMITVTYTKSLQDFPKYKTKWIGALVREDLSVTKKDKGYNLFNLDKTKPVVLIVGGGTGAFYINQLVKQSLDELLKFCQVIHIYGKGRDAGCANIQKKGYWGYPFLQKEFPIALAVADLVVSRSGMGSLNEFAYLGKPAIVIPIPDSHQEDNAQYFFQKQAVVYLSQKGLDSEKFIHTIKTVLFDKQKLQSLSKNIKKLYKKGALDYLVNIILYEQY